MDNLAAANSPAASGLPAPLSVLIIDDNKGLASAMANLNALPHVGATYFFSKPISAQTLLARLRESIGHSR